MQPEEFARDQAGAKTSERGDWVTPSAFPSLDRGQVHVWRVPLGSLDQAIDDERALLALLSPDETRRASRYRFERDRRRFVRSRATLRRLLAGYVGIAPTELEFALGPAGKPALVGPEGRSSLVNFNVSHSQNLALVAVARECELGVDLERIQPFAGMMRLADHMFAEGERRALLTLPESDRAEGFFACWTRKEAYIKALGVGLSYDLKAFEVSVVRNPPVDRLLNHRVESELHRWTMRALYPDPGYMAAVVAEGEPCVLQCWNRAP